jgi:hypothetical protein
VNLRVASRTLIRYVWCFWFHGRHRREDWQPVGSGEMPQLRSGECLRCQAARAAVVSHTPGGPEPQRRVTSPHGRADAQRREGPQARRHPRGPRPSDASPSDGDHHGHAR